MPLLDTVLELDQGYPLTFLALIVLLVAMILEALHRPVVRPRYKRQPSRGLPLDHHTDARLLLHIQAVPEDTRMLVLLPLLCTLGLPS
jgi:hypothetical protein